MQVFRASELVPPGFVVENFASDDDRFVIEIRAVAAICRCPSCGEVCGRVHSRYRRTVADLPAAGRRAALILRARRFFCDVETCKRRIFAERFEGVVETRASGRPGSTMSCIVSRSRSAADPRRLFGDGSMSR
jgi:transposase